MGTQQREDTMPMTEEQAQQELESVLKEDGPETIQLESVAKEDGPETLQAFLARHPGAVHQGSRDRIPQQGGGAGQLLRDAAVGDAEGRLLVVSPGLPLRPVHRLLARWKAVHHPRQGAQGEA